MPLRNEAQFFTPQNRFEQDPFATNVEQFFNFKSVETGVSVSELRKIYRYVPVSLIALTVAQAACQYVEQYEDGNEVAILKKSRAEVYGKIPYLSLLTMCEATELLVAMLIGDNVKTLRVSDLIVFHGQLIIVEDAMHTGEQMERLIKFFHKKNDQLKVSIFLAAASAESVNRVCNEFVTINTLTVLPRLLQLVTNEIAEKITPLMTSSSSLLVTAHKLPDTQSLSVSARTVAGKESSSLYPPHSQSNYPHPETIAKYAYNLFL